MPDAHSPISPSNQACARQDLPNVQISFNKRPPSVITNKFNEAEANSQCDKAVKAGIVNKEGCRYLGDTLPVSSSYGQRILLWSTTDQLTTIVQGNVDSAGMPAGDPPGFGGVLDASSAGASIPSRILRNIQITDEFRQSLINRRRTAN